MGIYDIGSFLLGEVPILLMGRIDLATLEHEVRHYVSYECKRYPYINKKRAALDFLREYYWEERHIAIAKDKLIALRREADEISRMIGEKQYEAALELFENLSRGEFPENKYLSDALACIITEASPWVSEGFASEENLIEAAKVPLKLFIGAATGGYLYKLVPLLFSTSPPYFLALAYLSGGLLNLSYSFLRTLSLDIGAMRWRRMRAKIEDKDIPKVLAYPPTENKTREDILVKLKDYSIF